MNKPNANEIFCLLKNEYNLVIKNYRIYRKIKQIYESQ